MGIITNLLNSVSSSVSSLKIDTSKLSEFTAINDELARNIALQYALDMYNQAQKEMNRFYTDYTPKVYKRTEGMHNFSYIPLVRKTATGYQAGVRICDYRLGEGQYNSRPVDAILRDVYSYGQHGSWYFYQRGLVKKMTRPTPAMALEQYAKEHLATLLSGVRSNPGAFKNPPRDISSVYFE